METTLRGVCGKQSKKIATDRQPFKKSRQNLIQ